jgi:hypothetical protein
LTRDEIVQLARNAFTVSWLAPDERDQYLDALEAYHEARLISAGSLSLDLTVHRVANPRDANLAGAPFVLDSLVASVGRFFVVLPLIEVARHAAQTLTF